MLGAYFEIINELRIFQPMIVNILNYSTESKQ